MKRSEDYLLKAKGFVFALVVTLSVFMQTFRINAPTTAQELLSTQQVNLPKFTDPIPIAKELGETYRAVVLNRDGSGL